MVQITEIDADKIASYLRNDIIKLEKNISKAQELYEDVKESYNQLDIKEDSKDIADNFVKISFEKLEEHHKNIIKGLEAEIDKIAHLIDILISGSDFLSK